MSDSLYTVILFHSTSHAIRAEKILQESGISCKMIPVPRHLSSDCGVCIRVEADLRQRARKILKDARVETEGIEDI